MDEPAVSICSKFAKSKLKINLPLIIKRKTITKKKNKENIQNINLFLF